VTHIVYRHGRRVEVETLNPDPLPVKRSKPLFTQVPLELAARAAKATDGQRMLVWVLILHRCWKERTQTVPVTNDMMRKYGINRHVKVRALRQLETAGLVTVQWRAAKNPIATLAW
jgi:hypothetical protein